MRAYRRGRPPAGHVQEENPGKTRIARRGGVESGMNPQPPATPDTPPAAAVAITETQAFTRAWVLFVVLVAAVVGVLWAVKAWLG